MRVPDAITPITAWRAWRIGTSIDRSGAWTAPLAPGDPRMLCALRAGEVWPPGKPVEARCARLAQIMASIDELGQPHVSPDEGCRCGLYAARTLQLLVEGFGYVLQAPRLVVGQVQLWGKVVVATRGYRAQNARVARLFAKPGQWEVVEELCALYRVPAGGHLHEQLDGE